MERIRRVDNNLIMNIRMRRSTFGRVGLIAKSTEGIVVTLRGPIKPTCCINRSATIDLRNRYHVISLVLNEPR
jgi:hypothetical protein